MRIVDNNGNPVPEQQSKRIIAGILAIIFGSIGLHKFILGYTKEGIIMLLMSTILIIFTFGLSYIAVGLISFIEGIIYLTKTDEEFVYEYQINKRPWF